MILLEAYPLPGLQPCCPGFRRILSVVSTLRAVPAEEVPGPPATSRVADRSPSSRLLWVEPLEMDEVIFEDSRHG